MFNFQKSMNPESKIVRKYKTIKDTSNLSPINLKQLKTVIYKNKHFPEEYVGKKTKLVNSILEQEKKRLNLIDTVLQSDEEEEIADTVRKELLEIEKKRIFYENQRPKVPPNKQIKNKGGVKTTPAVPFLTLKEHKLKTMFAKLEKGEELNGSQKQLQKCLSTMFSTKKKFWLSPSYLIKAMNECLLTRNWNNLTHLLLEFIHLTDNRYKPIIKHLYQIMDRLHPVIAENDLQGEYKNIKSYNQKILNTTRVV